MATLLEYMNEQGITQRELAAALGLSKSYTNELVNGGKSPRLATALKIHRLTDGKVSLETLVKSPSNAPAQRAE